MILGELIVDAIEEILLVALVVKDNKLRRIEKAPSVQAVELKEVSSFLGAVSEIERTVGGAEVSIGRGNVSCGLGQSLSRAGRDVNDQAGLVAIFGGRRSGNHFDRLHGIGRELVGEDFALLVGHRLAINRKRIRRVIAEAMEETVGVGRHSGR